MAPTYVSMIGFLTLIVWRFVLSARRRRHSARAVATPEERRKNALEHGLHFLRPRDLPADAGNCFEDGSDGAGSVGRKDRAKTYLRRVLVLTGAAQIGRSYVLDVGKMRFQVRYRFVSRLQDPADPKASCQQTCFYPVHEEMPKAEEIATVLLQLANNPALFDKWAAQSGAYKANGQAFTRAQ